MKLTIEEKKILFAFGCANLHSTVNRLKFLASITVDPGIKDIVLKLARKLDCEGAQDWYRCFFYHLRMEMESFFHARLVMKLAEVSTIEVEDCDNETDEV